MHKKIITILFLMILQGLFSFSYAAAEEGSAIHWQKMSPAVFEEAKKEHKMVLIYGKVSWCHWCQKMDASSFPDPRVVQLINSHFIPVKVDIEKDSGTGGRYKISEIPSMVILSSRDQEIKRFYGYASPQSILRRLTDITNQY